MSTRECAVISSERLRAAHHAKAHTPPTPVERVDGSPQLGLPSESLIKAEGFWDCYFLGMLR